MRIASSQPLLLVAAIFLVSCDRPAIDPSQSLVGAKELPPAKLLSRESIYVSRGYGDWGRSDPGRLSYELSPDNRLAITLADYESGKEMVRGSETFRLASTAASQARRDLWRLRPEPLRGVEWDQKPVGCRSDTLHDFPDIAVAFIAEGPKPGHEDDKVGIFTLPHPSSCNSKQAQEARKLLDQVIKKFPPSKIAAQFERRMSLLEAKLGS